jgi:hypothetical protein
VTKTLENQRLTRLDFQGRRGLYDSLSDVKRFLVRLDYYKVGVIFGGVELAIYC